MNMSTALLPCGVMQRSSKRCVPTLRRKRQPGTYDLITYNCLTFCEEALSAGGIHLITRSGRKLHTIIPKDAFKEVAGAKGAHPYQAWKYWFPLGEPPQNGLRTIQDVPGKDKPLRGQEGCLFSQQPR